MRGGNFRPYLIKLYFMERCLELCIRVDKLKNVGLLFRLKVQVIFVRRFKVNEHTKKRRFYGLDKVNMKSRDRHNVPLTMKNDTLVFRK